LYRLSAEQGNAGGQTDLGVMYLKGLGGVLQDYAEAARLFTLAAEQGANAAQYDLGLLYAQGQGVPQDYVRAHMWFNLSAAGGNQEAVKDRDTITHRMTPDQIAEAQKLAREWKPKPTQ
jgi:TPR repeat protein